MWIPKRLYEALPAIYSVVGALIVMNASYIGFSFAITLGYMTLGWSCMIAGMCVGNIRSKARVA